MSRPSTDTEPRWCATCGSLVPPDRDTCPHCGMPMPRAASVGDRSGHAEPDIDRRPTTFLPRLASAIPSGNKPDDESPRRQRTTLAIVIAAICVVGILGGAFLVFAHPWDPNLYDTRAQEPADTSMEGYPGSLERLQGQDSDGVVGVNLTSDQATYRDLSADVDRMRSLAEELDGEFETLERDYAADLPVREEDAATARRTSISISNLIKDVQNLDMSSGAYLESQRQLVQMGNYLRNRADALTDAWDASLGAEDPSSDKLRVLDEADAQNESYRTLFEESLGRLELPEPAG